jgi:hypothetical protein
VPQRSVRNHEPTSCSACRTAFLRSTGDSRRVVWAANGSLLARFRLTSGSDAARLLVGLW